ncbi:MAG: DUF2848 family protein [Deltaproteobacteria bacterium]|nr:DUF2848 family protein [Deltaproteobacteria bacterium]
MFESFTLEEENVKREVSLDIKGLVLCGYTGRDQKAVKKHIEELKKEGIEPPPSVPMYYPKTPSGIKQTNFIDVQGSETSGEIEYLLVIDKDDIFISLGSDHTDREMERLDILKSKQVCPSVVSKDIWSYKDVKDHWDKIEIRSWAVKSGERTLYQESTLSTMLCPEDLVDLVGKRVIGSLDGMAILSGTPPILTGEMIFADRFEGELYDPILKRKITIDYSVKAIDWFSD